MKTAAASRAGNQKTATVPLVAKPRGKMGRRLESLDTPLPPGLRGQFCKRFRKVVKAKGVAEVAVATGLSENYVRQIVSGRRVPDIDRWPDIAKRLGLSHWVELFDVRLGG